MRIIGKLYEPLSKFIRQSKNHVETAGENLLPRAEDLKQIQNKQIPATNGET